MPSPLGFKWLQPDANFYNLTEDNKDDNRLTTLYVTNRIPNSFSTKNSRYTIFPSNDLRFGLATHMVGDQEETWEDFYEKSLSPERDEKYLINLLSSQELLVVKEDHGIDQLGTREKELFANLNQVLERAADKDITIYVHGANSNFYRATAQGAQYFHYTGHNSIILTFSWPSAENILRYKEDVLHARMTVPAFTRVIELLAHHTIARNINIIAYSAGAQVAAPALVHLREKYSKVTTDVLKKRFRLGEVYFAAPDIEVKSFAYRLAVFKDIVERITISSNMSDSVLHHASMHFGKSRLGKPDAKELSEEEIGIFVQFSKTRNLDLLDIEGSESLHAGTSHSFWYSHSWVSNDLLFIMLLSLSPEKRGLLKYQDEYGLVTYYFPDDYETRIKRLLEVLRNQ